jgi:5-methylcytosine-specific restriction protein A
MATFLFAWNPKKWEWKESELTDKILQVAQKGLADYSWSCGNRRHLPIGSRCFLIRLGQEPRGIVGSGRTTSHPSFGSHWDQDLRREGKEALFVDLRFDFLSKVPLISWNELNDPPFSKFSWGIQASGVKLPESVANVLEGIWKPRTRGDYPITPDEVSSDSEFPEGGRNTISVNAYERDLRARAACIALFGFNCFVCDLLLEDRYGTIAAGFIHVHHITRLSKVVTGYKVNPKKDLRPICPNCHAIIHRRKPPLSIKEARRMIKHLGSIM